MIFHDYPYSAPRFQSALATRCLRCHSTNLDTEDILQNADEEWSEDNPPREETFWFCRDCSGADAVNVGVGVMNEVTRRVSWSHKYLQAADEGTSGVSMLGGEPRYQIGFNRDGRIEIISLRGHLPSVDEALSSLRDEPDDWPLQVSTRASAFALVLRELPDELESEEEVLDASAIFCGEEISGREMWREVLAVGPFSRLLFWKRDDENLGGKVVAWLQIVDGEQRLEALGEGAPSAVGLANSALSPLDGESYLDAILLRYSGSRLWAAREVSTSTCGRRAQCSRIKTRCQCGEAP